MPEARDSGVDERPEAGASRSLSIGDRFGVRLTLLKPSLGGFPEVLTLHGCLTTDAGAGAIVMFFGLCTPGCPLMRRAMK